MEAILGGSVSGLTFKRTMCSMMKCDLVDILMGEMDGEDELRRRRLKLKLEEMGEKELSLDGDKKCKRVMLALVGLRAVRSF